jgi:recombination protein RecT
MTKAAEKTGSTNGNGSTIATIGKWLTDRREDLAKLMPKHMTPERLTAVALNCISKVPQLNDCTVLSLYQCIRACAELGLEPGGSLGHAYLVPFRDGKSGTVTCTLIIGYRGYIELARRSGQLVQVEAHVVHEGDDFELEYGLEPKLVHRPKMGLVGAPVAAYCVAKLAGGAKHVEVMTWAEITKIKESSRASKSGPWVDHTEEMAKKTVVRRAAKYWPLSAEMRTAMDAEDEYVDGQVVTPAPRLAADSNVVNFAPAAPVDATARAKAAVAEKLGEPAHDPTTGEVLPVSPEEAAEIHAAEAATRA